MNSIHSMPCMLIESICKHFCDELYRMSDKNREIAVSISQFEDDLRNFIIRELYASSIIEEK
jgi:hypothetical protein